jgi:hypothetical protein
VIFFFSFFLLTFIIFNSVTIFPIEGFKLGSEKHTTEAIVKKSGALQLTSGIEGLALLKTTKVNSFLFHVSDSRISSLMYFKISFA